jgi:hypothetical protein
MLLVMGMLLAVPAAAGGKSEAKPEMCGPASKPETAPELKCASPEVPVWRCWYNGPRYEWRWVPACEMPPG